ncbi:uncharacterized protein LOC117223071 [Megalopta genalis]|uniref:uncharacterized protein LOC117223071 n=1 Tax=Megalopta genalis TaxID=115081 RepID=UPI003FD69F6E
MVINYILCCQFLYLNLRFCRKIILRIILRYNNNLTYETTNIPTMLSISQYSDTCPEDVTNNCTNVIDSSIADSCNESRILNDLQCFVCDATIQGRHYELATCRTQTSRSRVIEKLGELVGERYMVVISEDDVICRSCANRINTLDRLEVEMITLRDKVLRFLEQKYSLEEGELLDINEKQKRSQPPQITKCKGQPVTNHRSKKRDIVLPSPVNERMKNKKSNIWLQCDKCQYTTLHNSFMVHHVREHSKQKVFCDKCGVQFYGNQQESHNCDFKEHITDQNRNPKEHSELSMKGISETVINIPILEKSMQSNLPMMTIDAYSQTQISNHNENVPVIRLSNSEHLPIQNILTSDNVPSGQSIYVRVLQPVEINETPMHPTMIAASNTDLDLSMKFKDNSGKQVLTLTEDGSLEMTEVSCWNDIHPSESQSNITFQ